MATIRETLTSRIQRLVQKRQQAVALAQELAAEIDALRLERDMLTLSEEDRLLRLQGFGVIKEQD